MRQGWQGLGRIAGMVAAATLCGSLIAHAAPSKPSSSGTGLHQFTGIVTSLDPSTITVEKGGRSPRTMVFTKHAEMRTTGQIDKNARVTVYYRDEGGKAIAHRVVIARPRATRSRSAKAAG